MRPTAYLIGLSIYANSFLVISRRVHCVSAQSQKYFQGAVCRCVDEQVSQYMSEDIAGWQTFYSEGGKGSNKDCKDGK